MYLGTLIFSALLSAGFLNASPVPEDKRQDEAPTFSLQEPTRSHQHHSFTGTYPEPTRSGHHHSGNQPAHTGSRTHHSFTESYPVPTNYFSLVAGIRNVETHRPFSSAFRTPHHKSESAEPEPTFSFQPHQHSSAEGPRSTESRKHHFSSIIAVREAQAESISTGFHRHHSFTGSFTGSFPRPTGSHVHHSGEETRTHAHHPHHSATGAFPTPTGEADLPPTST